MGRVKRKKRKNPDELLPWEHFGKPPSYEASHWGRAPRSRSTREVTEPGDNEELIALGTLVQVVYRTSKGDLVNVEFEHEFNAPRPLLTYGSDDGRLYLVGGGYKVTRRGIVR